MKYLFRIVVLMLSISFMTVPANAGLQTYENVPDGFQEYIVQKGDTWFSVASGKEDYALLAMRINRIDARHLQPGMRVLVPTSEAAFSYAPVPKVVNDEKARHLIIYLDIQYFGAYERGELVHWGPISSGKPGHETVIGTFHALWKDRWHRSRKYGNVPMFFAVQFYGNFFTHEQSLPGYPASHGCVRMLKEDAQWKFSWIQKGDPVTVLASSVQ